MTDFPGWSHGQQIMSRHGITWVALFAVMTLMFLRLPQMAARQDAVVNTYAALVEVDALAHQQYVEVLDGNRLVEGAIRGMLRQLDPYSAYIAPDELAAFERRSRGGYMGVGLVLGLVDGAPSVIAPIESSPAARAGIKPGDLILSINGQDVTSRSVFEIDELLVGKPNTKVQMRVLHQGERTGLTVTMKREPVHMVSVRGFGRQANGQTVYLADPDAQIAYLRVSNFHDGTQKEFDRALNTLVHAGARGLVIDLRFNPGGTMFGAVAMVDRFLEDGVILATVTRRQAVDEYRATPADTVTDLPLVVLVNGSSASSAEIVSGSLQARERATIVGTRSFGKGSVQHLIHLTGHPAAVKLTTAHYRLPDGRFIHRNHKNALTQNWGVIPDVVVELTEEERTALRRARHELDSAFLGAENDRDAAAGSDARTWLLPLDNQLARAIEILKASPNDSFLTQ